MGRAGGGWIPGLVSCTGKGRHEGGVHPGAPRAAWVFLNESAVHLNEMSDAVWLPGIAHGVPRAPR